jgi:hypothetical protein
VPRAAIVVGRLSATALMGVLVAVWFLVVGFIFGARGGRGLAGVLVVLVLAPLAAAAFGSLAAALALRTGRASVVQGIFPLVSSFSFSPPPSSRANCCGSPREAWPTSTR